MTPNTQITQENVGLLKAGDVVKVTNACSFLKSKGYPNGSLVTVRSFGGEYIDIAEIPYPQSTYAHRFTYIGPPPRRAGIGQGRGDDYEGPDAGMHDTEIDDRDDEDTTPAPAETFEGFNLSNIKRTDAPAVDWNVVGPKLVDALERIAADGEPYRNGYCQTDIAIDPALTAQEAQDVARDALAAAQPQSNGDGL